MTNEALQRQHQEMKRIMEPATRKGEEKINQYHIKTFYHRSFLYLSSFDVAFFFVFLPFSHLTDVTRIEGGMIHSAKQESERESMENALLPL